MKKTFLFVIALLILAACSGPGADITGEWKLVSYGDPANPTVAIPDIDTSINFDAKGQVGGDVGCNTFGGSYELNGDKITFGAMMSTMMFCELVSIQEHDVLGVISDGKDLQIQINGDLLTITSADGLSVVNLARK